MQQSNEDFIWQCVGAGVVGVIALVLLWLGFRFMRRKRLVENVATSKVAGVFLGLTEVKGAAERDRYIKSYLAEIECCWYSYDVQEHWQKTETYTDSQGKTRTRTSSGWTSVRSGDVREPFFIRDDTGRIQIVPAQADMEGDSVFSRTVYRGDPLYYAKGPAGSIANSTGRRSFTEYAIRPKQQIFTIGTARLREDVVEPEIAYGADDEMFLISVRNEEQILRSFAWKGAASIVGSLVLLNVAPNIILAHEGATAGEVVWAALPYMAGLTALHLLGTFIYYLTLVYNGLVSVRNRVAMSWSQIDIQLKRRFDLIPNLVASVKGYVQHEKETMETLAKVRVEGVQRAGGVSGMSVPVAGAAMIVAAAADEQTHALSSLFGIVERYPKIKADRSFGKLTDELSKTETKIALARSFYNESVTSLNNRIETLPDALVAGFGGFKKADYFKIEEFEKVPVVVKLDGPREGEAESGTGTGTGTGPAPERETSTI